METGRHTLRQSMLCWKIAKMWLRMGATYLPITVFTGKNMRIDTAQQSQIDRTGRELMNYFFGTIKCREICRNF